MAEEISTLEEMDTEEFVESMKNKNTKRKTCSNLKILLKWLHNYEDFRAVDEIPATKLDKLLAKFFMTVKKKIIEMSMSHTQLRPFREVSADF